MAVAALVLALVAADLVVSERVTGRTIGFSIEGGERPLDVLEVEPGSPAEAGGLRPGDRIVAVGGTPVAVEADYDAVARSFRRGRPVRFTVRRDGRTLELELRPGMRWFGWSDALGVAAILGYLALGLAALGYAGSDRRAVLLFAFSSAVAVELALPGNIVGVQWERVLSTIAYYLLNGLQFAIEVHLASVIPKPRPCLERRPWLPAAFYGTGLLLAAVPAAAIAAAVRGAKGFPITITAASYFFDHGVFLLWAAAVPAILLGGVRLARTPRERSQALLVLLGVLPWTVHTYITAIWRLLGGQVPGWLEDVAPLVLLVYPVAVFVAIFRHQLFDIEVAVRRSLVYGALTGLLLVIFYAAIAVGGALVSSVLGEVHSVWVFSGATLLLGLLASPLHRLVQEAIDRRVFPERRRLAERLVRLAGELPALGALPAMGRHLVGELEHGLGAERVALLLADPASGVLAELASSGPAAGPSGESLLLAADDPGIEAVRRAGRPLPADRVARSSGALAQRLGRYGARVVVPLLAGERLVGLLLLGPRAGGAPYRTEDLGLLALLGRNVAAVFENVRLFQSATYEGLTGLLRREAILDRLELELERARRYRRPLSVGVADLDRFKEVNDEHGHLAGDAVLKLVAGTIRSGLRASDAVGRYGGEEFLLVLPETTMEGARGVAEKVRAAIEALEIPIEGGELLRVTISIGLATRDPESRSDPTARELIAAADANLLEAKRRGRNRVVP